MHAGADAVRRILERYPRAELSRAPTPIDALPRISARLGRDVYAKREDLTGFALGGNKVRKLDYLLGDACAKGADTFVVSGASSFSRNAAAAGRSRGIEVHVVIAGPEHQQNAASEALFRQLEAHVHRAPGPQALASEQERLVAELAARGRRVYALHPGGSDPIGTLGYVEVAAEICAWSATRGVTFDAIYHPSGSAATQAGLALGLAIGGYAARLIGVAVSQLAAVQRERVGVLAHATAAMLGVALDGAALQVEDRFLGDGYPIPSAASCEAVDLFAREEGLLLDAVYTGKAAAALIGHAASGELREGERALFIHTGGNAGLYY